VVIRRIRILKLFVFATLFYSSVLSAAGAEETMPFAVSADACDDIKEGYDKQTAEYRAVDQASLLAVKTSGLIQKQNVKMLPAVLDVVAYRIIDEYLFNVKHEITHADATRVCVHVSADVEITASELQAIIDEHEGQKKLDSTVVAEVSEEVNAATEIKPQSLTDKKLLFIENMKFWNGTEDNHYTEFLTELFSHSDYYYVTDNEDIADIIVVPWLHKAEVDKLDDSNRKMQMLAELTVSAPRSENFPLISEKQNHFILFAEDKEEQKIADTLLRKLLTRAASAVDGKLVAYLQKDMENSRVRAGTK